MIISTFILHFSILVTLIISCSNAMDKDAILNSDDDRHEMRPRFFGGIFSRPKPEAEKQHAGGLKEHFGNVLRGGSIGFQAEFKPLAPIHGLIDHAKKIIPIPGIQKPTSVFNPHGGKKPDSWWNEEDEKKEEPIPEYEWKNPKDDPKDYPKDDPKDNPKPEIVDSEDQYGWEPQNPKEEAKTNGPRWEDIGEDSSDYYNDHTTVPIEDIIQPRHRPKRRAESKVYYLPLDFLTNGKPYKVRVGTNDGI